MSSDRKDSDAEARAKKRESAFAQWRNAILRESSNPASLANVRARALHDSEVRNDPPLAAMITQFVAEREAALKKAHAAHDVPHATRTPSVAPTFYLHHEGHSRAEAAAAAIALSRQVHHYLANFFESQAREALGHLESIASQHPDIVARGSLEQFRRRLANLKSRRDKLHDHIAEIGRRAVEASVAGDHEKASQALRRLSSIHTARPHVLPDDKFEVLRQAIIHASNHHDHRLATKQLVDKERRVAAELKGLWSVIHHFHEVSRGSAHDSEEYRRAEAGYHRAMGEVRSHDPDWLAELVLELVGFLDELEDAPPTAQAHVDHFIASVRRALGQIRSEVEQIEKERDRPG